MNNQIYKSIVRYFRRLGLAIVSKDYVYSNIYVALNERVEKAETDVKQLREMYNIALDKWKSGDCLVEGLSNEVARLNGEIASYQQLVETLRGTIRDKQKMIEAYVKAEEVKG